MRFATRLLLTALLFLAVPTQGLQGALHLALVRSAPTQGQQLTKAPERLQLWFSEVPAAGISQITLTLGDHLVELGKTVIVEKEKAIYADPVKPLATGSYKLSWKTAGHDGHALTGHIAFSIAPK